MEGNSTQVNSTSGLKHLVKSRVAEGFLVTAPTTASSQVTGTGASDFNVNISHGLALIGGKAYEKLAQADFDLASSAAQQMAAGQSRVYSICIWKNNYNKAIGWKTLAGPAATTGAEVALTDAELAAEFADETVIVRVADVTVNRTADETITQSQDNSVRNLMIVQNIHEV